LGWIFIRVNSLQKSPQKFLTKYLKNDNMRRNKTVDEEKNMENFTIPYHTIPYHTIPYHTDTADFI